jgi:hypothetical protein
MNFNEYIDLIVDKVIKKYFTNCFKNGVSIVEGTDYELHQLQVQSTRQAKIPMSKRLNAEKINGVRHKFRKCLKQMVRNMVIGQKLNESDRIYFKSPTTKAEIEYTANQMFKEYTTKQVLALTDKDIRKRCYDYHIQKIEKFKENILEELNKVEEIL